MIGKNVKYFHRLVIKVVVAIILTFIVVQFVGCAPAPIYCDAKEIENPISECWKVVKK